ncbi:MAG TPA: AAA family ATPase [Planctomycetota bacterium]|nr:AAA family ATPase [Planctomycetota bacterium]
MTSIPQPRVLVLAGPNGAGKSTTSQQLVHDQLGIANFVNADTIARGLAAFEPERVAAAAGRIMLHRLRELAAARADFAFETNLASRTLAPWLTSLRASGYRLLLVFLWLPSAEAAITRVRCRVREGGHHVPDEIVRRRYERGLANLRSTFLPMADAVWLFDSSRMPARLVASGPPAALTELDHDVVRRILP